MGPDPKILDDIARVAGGAVNIVSGLQQQIREEIKSRIDEMADRMDLVPREDMDRAEAMIKKMRVQLDDLEKRVAAMDGKSSAPAKKSPAKKAAAKKADSQKKPAAKKAAAKKQPAKKSGSSKNKK